MTGERAEGYLAISASYGGSLGGLVWSGSLDAIERWNGTTFVFADEIRAVLEGVFARPPVPPFEFVLALLRVMRDGPDAVSVEFDRLWRAYTLAKGATGLLRNAGRLIAELCRAVPPAADPPAWQDVAAAIGRRAATDHWVIREEPTLPRPEFERAVEGHVARYDDEALLHWLTHGCRPSGAGGRLAEPVESLPVRVARLLALARCRPRLVGAATLVPALEGAITLPPRRRSHEAVPQGGYSDVTTRGEPERLLPGQFALDRDEFVRRYAERELLFFQREEPHTAPKPERVIVLDQGVRAWGGVRLALAAAALVLMKYDSKRTGRVRLAATSAAATCDLLEADPDAVASLLEASDLTPHCGPCLRAVLADRAADGPRDVVLLTHPRTLREPPVLAAVNGRQAADRLFALTVGDRGEAALHDWTEGGPVPVRSFRVDLGLAEAAGVGREARAEPQFGVDWAGDVEPVGFPFRPGLMGDPLHLGFDAAGEWLVVVGRDGVLHGLAVGDSPPEVLPRACQNGSVLKQVDAVLGVLGGVVVCGRMRSPPGETLLCPIAAGVSTTAVAPGAPVIDSSAPPGDGPPVPPTSDVFVAAHYDRRARKVAVHVLGPASNGARWSAFPELHCVAVTDASAPGHPTGCAVDLATQDRYPCTATLKASSRAMTAWGRAFSPGGESPVSLPVRTRWSKPEGEGHRPYLELAGNAVQPKGTERPWEPFEPTRDGKPLLGGASVRQTQLAGDVLAMAVKRTGGRNLLLIERTRNGILANLELPSAHSPIALSRDGRMVAYVRAFRTVVVAEAVDAGVRRAEARPAALHNSGLVVRFLYASCFRLSVSIGGFTHVFSLCDGELCHKLEHDETAQQRKAATGPFHHPPTAYDPARFPAREIAHAWGWRAVPDRLGQVLLYKNDDRLVASFLVRRERAAAWAPGDVFWGDPVLIGGPPAPNAAREIGAAIAEGPA